MLMVEVGRESLSMTDILCDARGRMPVAATFERGRGACSTNDILDDSRGNMPGLGKWSSNDMLEEAYESGRRD
jgi:hypothetical protein